MNSVKILGPLSFLRFPCSFLSFLSFLFLLMIFVTLSVPLTHSQANTRDRADLTAVSKGQSLHVLMIDSCMLPQTVDLLQGRNVVFEFVTSGNPVLKKLFNPSICTDHYSRAVGPVGKIAGFHSRFLGKKMKDAEFFKKTLDLLVKKRGPIDVVLANASDLAIYMGGIARQHLDIRPAHWNITTPECFYDKLTMKEALVSLAPAIHTAPFVGLDWTPDKIENFVKTTPFPLIFKRRRSAASVGIQIVKDQKQFQEVFEQIKDKSNYLVEQFITGQSLRIDGEKENGKILFSIPTFMRTSPLEHFQSGKSRVQTTIDESEVPLATIQDFVKQSTDALGMNSGTFHVEAIFSEQEKVLYFVEAGARPGAGNMETVLRDLHDYDPARTFYFRQVPANLWQADQQSMFQDIVNKAHDRSHLGHVYAVLSYPFKDSNRFSLQNVKTNLHPATLGMSAQDIMSFGGCGFDKSIENANPGALETKGIGIFRFTYEVGNMAIWCHFKGTRDQVERDLRSWQERFNFNATPSSPFLNRFVPRKLFTAGGLE